jgi:nicotinate-nucleotide pyrophosphorylase (carboxylating)
MDDIDYFLEEDLGDKGDITSDSLLTNETAEAIIIAKENCIIAGLEETKKIYKKLKVNIETLVKDGDFIKKNSKVATIKGQAKSILKGERLALNFICKMSGIATETKKLVEKCRKNNPNVTIAATRKTTPGFRKYEKKAVALGGGETHRFGLYDAILIKDNHLKTSDSIEKTIKKIKQKNPDKAIEIEIENKKDAISAAKLGVNTILLDNFKPEEAKKIVKKIREINPGITIEISGGITPKNIINYASFADRISMGYLTNNLNSIDFSLEIL